MSRIVGIVQARTDSTRFPAKMLSPLNGMAIIDWVLTRVCRAEMLDSVVVATSKNQGDDLLVAHTRAHDVEVVRGSQDDVLGRFIQALDEHEADHVVRICADNPFIAPEEIDRLVTSYLRVDVDYAFNHQSRIGSQYVDGLGAEIIASSVLRRIANATTEGAHREHVTSYVWGNQAEFKILAVPAPPELAFPHIRLDIDTVSDLDHLQSLVKTGAIDPSSTALEIVRAYNRIYGPT